MKNLIEVAKADPGELPFTINTMYKFHSTQRYPEMILKVGGKLFFDKKIWEKLVEETREEQVIKAKNNLNNQKGRMIGPSRTTKKLPDEQVAQAKAVRRIIKA